MNSDRIDFISAYCDRWCERCAFTSRCSAFAVRAAEAMCGSFAEALELAVGARRRMEAAEADRLTAREDSGEPREVTDLAASGLPASSQRGPAAEPGFASE